jgi:hypothetical protein
MIPVALLSSNGPRSEGQVASLVQGVGVGLGVCAKG